MWNIPETVKALYKMESVVKMWQIYFPNGEHSRAGNSALIQESVRFTESICSQDQFRFGLAENSVIEFEIVGWSDMRGQWIEVYLEICIDSLTAAQKQEIRDGNYDGEIKVWNDTTNYRISIGKFIVASCPRTHEWNQHRKVTAYSEDLFSQIQPAEWVKLLCPIATVDKEQSGGIHWPAAVYEPNVIGLVTAQLAYNDKTVMTDWAGQPSYIAPNFVNQAAEDFGYTVRVTTENNHNIEISIKNYIRRMAHTSDYHNTRPIVGFTQDPEMNEQWKATIAEALDALNIKWGIAKINNTLEIPCFSAKELIELIEPSKHIYDGVSYGTGDWDLFKVTCTYAAHTKGPYIAGTDVYTSYSATFDTSDTKYFSFYYGGRNDFRYLEMSETYSFDLRIRDITAGTTSTISFTRANTPSLNRSLELYEIPTKDFDPGTIRIDPSGQQLGESTYANGYDILGVINGWFECMAMFVSPSRTGGRRMFQIPTTIGEEIVPENFSEFWADEYAGKEYGTIRFPYKTTAGDYALFDYRFRSSPGIYDMSDNTVLNMCSTARSDLINYFQTFFVPHIKYLELNTIDMEMVAIPWIEPGDYVSVTDMRNRVTTFYPTRQTITGIQFLREQIEATGNEKIE